jgi:hypothetical protein
MFFDILLKARLEVNCAQSIRLIGARNEATVTDRHPESFATSFQIKVTCR